MAAKLSAVIFVGSVRETRNADRVLAFAKKLLEPHFNTHVLDAKVLNLPTLQVPFHYQDPSKAPKNLVEANDAIKNADAFVFVIGEYNRSLQPGLKNLLDHFSPASYGYKPALLVPYSPSGTAGICAADSLLSILRELGITPTPAFGSIGLVEKALAQDGTVQAGHEFIKGNFELGVQQLHWYGQAFKKARTENKPPKVHGYLPN
jgi:NAD(P)H-dependent FMN reductase